MHLLLTALKKVLSNRVLCLATACSTRATATSAGVRVRALEMDIVVVVVSDPLRSKGDAKYEMVA